MTLIPNTAAAIRFLDTFRPGGPWVLTAITPDNNAPIETQTFTTLAAAEVWLEARQGRANLYFTVNPVIKPVSSKPSKQAMLGFEWLFADCDPRVGETIDSERVRILAALRNNNPPPTIIVSSGSGYQGFWKLDRLYRTDGDVKKAEELERYNRQIELNLGADSCHNIDRIMRLPGSLNLPDEKKRKKGRVVTLAVVVEAHDV